MKAARILPGLSVLLLVTLLMLSAPPAPVQAARGITLSPAEGPIGTEVTITGTEFNESTATLDKYAAIFFSNQEASTIDDIDIDVDCYELVREGVWLDEDGDFETTFDIPDELDDGDDEEDVTSGVYYVYVCHYVGSNIATRIRAVAEFTVTTGEISLSPVKGNAGDSVEISGSGFEGDEEIEVIYSGTEIPIYSGNEDTRLSGSFTTIIRVPESTTGKHTITVTAGSDAAEATFTVVPEAKLNPASGEPGDTIMVNGTGFGGLETVNIWFYNNRVGTAVTNIVGSFETGFNVPQMDAGIYSVDIEEGDNFDKVKFTIEAPVEPEPTPEPTSTSISTSVSIGNIAQGIVIGGSGFKGGATVTIEYDDQLLDAVTADSSGIFAAAFTVPPSTHGVHIITASDGENSAELEFTVEATAPPVPSLLMPLPAGEMSSPIKFSWQPVDDASLPVTYSLQIATGSDFPAASVVLEVNDLTKTEYTLSETEKLRLGASQDPYYWRVRAVDAASNEGNWANPQSFYVVSSGLPTWAIIALAVLAGIILLAIGYFVRSKLGGK